MIAERAGGGSVETARRPGSSLRKRVLTWGLALAALAFVAYAVPVRDRCEDPAAAVASAESGAKPPKVGVSRDGDVCILHRKSGDERIDPTACAALKCEPGLVTTLKDASYGWLAALVVVYIAGTCAWSARWRSLLLLAGVKDISVWSTWRIILESQAAGVVLPGGVGGDALRIAFVVGKGAPTATVVASVILDRLIGLVTLATVAASMAAIVGGSELGPITYVLASIPFGLAAGLAALRFAHGRGLARAPIMQRRLFANVVKPVLEYVGDPRAPKAIGLAIVASLFVSAVQLVVVRGEILALGVVPTAERWVYVGATLAFIAGSIPALPGGWGTSDAAFVFFLARAGLPASTALAVSLLYRLIWYSSGGVGAVLLLMRNARSPT